MVQKKKFFNKRRRSAKFKFGLKVIERSKVTELWFVNYSVKCSEFAKSLAKITFDIFYKKSLGHFLTIEWLKNKNYGLEKRILSHPFCWLTFCILRSSNSQKKSFLGSVAQKLIYLHWRSAKLTDQMLQNYSLEKTFLNISLFCKRSLEGPLLAISRWELAKLCPKLLIFLIKKYIEGHSKNSTIQMQTRPPKGRIGVINSKRISPQRILS